MLIFIDITFNLVVGDELGNFDISLILCGIGIVLLNTNLLKSLRLDKNFIILRADFFSFSCYCMVFFFPGFNI